MATRDSGSSVDDNGPSVINPSGFFDDHKSVKCEVCGRGFKNQSALNGHMRLHGGYGQVNNSISGPGEPKLTVPMMENANEKGMESMLSVPTEKQLSRGVSNIIIVTSGPDKNSDQSIQSLLSLIPSSSNTSVNFSSHCNASSVRVLSSHHFTNSPKFDQSPSSHVVMESNNLPVDLYFFIIFLSST